MNEPYTCHLPVSAKIRFWAGDQSVDMDVVKAEMFIEGVISRLLPEDPVVDRNRQIVQEIQKYFRQEGDLHLDYSQAWAAMHHIRHAYAQFKKKLDADLGLDTGMDSTPGGSPSPTSKNSTDNSPNSKQNSNYSSDEPTPS